MFEREKKMYGRLREMQQDDIVMGGSAASYALRVSPSDAAYFRGTGGVVMRALLHDQHWMFSVEKGRGHDPGNVVISIMPGFAVTRLRDLNGAEAEV